MNFKRIISGLILFPLVAILLIFGNTYVVDVTIAVVAILSLYEFYKSFEGKAKPVTWLGYIAAASISLIHLVPQGMTLKLVGIIIPLSILLLFAIVIHREMKINIFDIAITFFGICYIVIFLMFISIIRENIPQGRILLWYVFFTSWGTDVFAYFVGKSIGKHKFTKISPNKTIEGCIGGTIGSVILVLIYTLICNTAFNMNINYIYILLVGIILSLIGQLGDLSASSIKRFNGIKDFSELIPGHGGMLDRIDSIIFIAPFAYLFLSIL